MRYWAEGRIAGRTARKSPPHKRPREVRNGSGNFRKCPDRPGLRQLHLGKIGIRRQVFPRVPAGQPQRNPALHQDDDRARTRLERRRVRPGHGKPRHAHRNHDQHHAKHHCHHRLSPPSFFSSQYSRFMVHFMTSHWGSM